MPFNGHPSFEVGSVSLREGIFFCTCKKGFFLKIKTSKQPIGVRCVTLAKRWLLMDAQALGVRIGVIVDTNDLVFLLV